MIVMNSLKRTIFKMDIRSLLFKILRRIFRLIKNDTSCSLVEFPQVKGNNFILAQLRKQELNQKGFLIAKFGSYELMSLVSYLYCYKKEPRISFFQMLESTCPNFKFESNLEFLSFNAGMFPKTIYEAQTLCEEYRKVLSQIDILASYEQNELLIKKAMSHCHFVDLEAFYAPFKFDSPWTQWLEGKKVLIVHPFVESIKFQYENNRKKIFDNPLVLPEFKSLEFIKAVQSAAGMLPEEFNSWHEALQYMKDEISKKDFDVALIGCGAYGLPLAAYVKSLGKVGIQLAGWTQMLFGIYGERWVTQQTEYKKFINSNWIRPNKNETPSKAKGVENGCYW